MESQSLINHRRFLIAIAVVLSVALLIRGVAAERYRDVELNTDAIDYDRHAVSIAEGDGFPESLPTTGGPGPSAWRPPLYPFFLGAVYAVTGTEDAEQRQFYGLLAQAVLGAIIVGLIALIALQLFGRREALIASAIAAIYPPLILAGSTLFTEPLFLVLMLAGLASVLHYRGNDPRIRWLVLAGFCAGLATLDRTNGVVAILVFALGAWVLEPRFSRRALAGPAVVVGAAILAILPWTIRNAVELDAFVPVSTQTGFALAGQYNEVAADNRSKWLAPFRVPAYQDLFLEEPPLGEVEIGERLTDRAKDFALDNPDHILAAAWWNTLRFFNLDDPVDFERNIAAAGGQPQGLAELSVYAFWLLALLAVIAVALGVGRRIPTFIWLILPLLMLSVVFVVAFTRYRTPLDPILILLASGGLVTGWHRLRSRTRWASSG